MKKIIQIPISEDLLAELDALSKKQDRSRASLIREACAQYIANAEEAEKERQYIEGLEKHGEAMDDAEAEAWMKLGIASLGGMRASRTSASETRRHPLGKATGASGRASDSPSFARRSDRTSHARHRRSPHPAHSRTTSRGAPRAIGRSTERVSSESRGDRDDPEGRAREPHTALTAQKMAEVDTAIRFALALR